MTVQYEGTHLYDDPDIPYDGGATSRSTRVSRFYRRNAYPFTRGLTFRNRFGRRW